MNKKLYKLDIIRAKFGTRLNRFVGKIYINNEVTYGHITNTGRLKEYLVRDKNILIKSIKGKKLKYRIVSVEDIEGKYAIIDTLTQNDVFLYLVREGMIRWLEGCRILKRNPRINGTVFDYLIRCKDKIYLVETKSAVLRGENNEAMYPDCPTIRGRRQIKTLINSITNYIPMLIFIAGLPNVSCFKPYRDGDSVMSDLIIKAYKEGLRIYAISIYMDGDGQIYLENPGLPLCIP
jgi:sugar fermentation stimulation protein A